jgi:hypothetical protein
VAEWIALMTKSMGDSLEAVKEHFEEVTKEWPPHEFPAASGLDGSRDSSREWSTIGLSSGDTIWVDPHRCPAFQPSQTVTVWQSKTVVVSNFGWTFECPEKWWIRRIFARRHKTSISILISR